MLFAQSLELRDLLHLWDHLLVFNGTIMEFVVMLSATYLLFRKKALMQKDFDGRMCDLRTTPEMTIMTMLIIAHQRWDHMEDRHSQSAII
jgi:hypothetical protein